MKHVDAITTALSAPMSRAQLATATGISHTTLSQRLYMLKQMGLVKRTGWGVSARWEKS